MGSRSSDVASGTTSTTGLTTFLQATDGVGANMNGIFVLLATNLIDKMDSAVLSRFPPVEIPKPDDAARQQILRDELHREDRDNPDYSQLSHRTEGWSGRDIWKACQQVKHERILQIDKWLGRLG